MSKDYSLTKDLQYKALLRMLCDKVLKDENSSPKLKQLVDSIEDRIFIIEKRKNVKTETWSKVTNGDEVYITSFE